MATLKLDIWKDEEGLTSLCFAGDLGAESRALLEPGSKIIHSIYAKSHYDAMTQYYGFMGWGKYDSDFESDREPYDLSQISLREKKRLIIDKILWEDWDPIGVNDVAPRDEYRGYVPQVLNMVLNNHSSKEIAKTLYQIETVNMGLFGNRKKCEEIAEKILNEIR